MLAEKIIDPVDHEDQSNILEASFVRCEFTKDKDLISEYIKVREYLFDNGGKKYKGAFMKREQDQFDNPEHPNSYIIVAYYRDICIGGARMVVREPFSNMRLPGLESNSFILQEKLPELDLEGKRYGEISRLAVLSEYTRFTTIICKQMYEKAIELKLDYTLWMGSMTRIRAYSLMCSKYNATFKIRYDIEVPQEFQSDPNIKKYLGVFDFAPEYRLLNNKKMITPSVITEVVLAGA